MEKRKTPAEWKARESLFWSCVSLVVSITALLANING